MDFIPIVERLGSLGILVLMVWRAPAIILAIQGLLNGVVDKVTAIQDKSLAVYERQQQAEREMVSVRFENIEKGIDKMGNALEASMRTQTEILHSQTEMRHRLELLEKTK